MSTLKKDEFASSSSDGGVLELDLGLHAAGDGESGDADGPIFGGSATGAHHRLSNDADEEIEVQLATSDLVSHSSDIELAVEPDLSASVVENDDTQFDPSYGGGIEPDLIELNKASQVTDFGLAFDSQFGSDDGTRPENSPWPQAAGKDALSAPAGLPKRRSDPTTASTQHQESKSSVERANAPTAVFGGSAGAGLELAVDPNLALDAVQDDETRLDPLSSPAEFEELEEIEAAEIELIGEPEPKPQRDFEVSLGGDTEFDPGKDVDALELAVEPNLSPSRVDDDETQFDPGADLEAPQLSAPAPLDKSDDPGLELAVEPKLSPSRVEGDETEFDPGLDVAAPQLSAPAPIEEKPEAVESPPDPEAEALAAAIRAAEEAEARAAARASDKVALPPKPDPIAARPRPPGVDVIAMPPSTPIRPDKRGGSTVQVMGLPREASRVRMGGSAAGKPKEDDVGLAVDSQLVSEQVDGETKFDPQALVPDALPLEAPKAVAPDPEVGEVIAGYELLELLGKGGAGSVFRAKRQRDGELFALKVLSSSKVTRERVVKRFFEEARTAKRVEHDCVVRLVEFIEVEEPRRLAFAMELVTGESLRDKLKRVKALPILEAIAVARRISVGLGVLHDAGIVHRDLKPENILLVEKEDGSVQAKILDYGVAKILDPEHLEEKEESGTFVGTPRYMAPEQAAGGDVDHRADLFALGVILFEMISGRRPHEGDSLKAVVMAKLKGAPRVTVNPNKEVLPQELSDIVDACLRLKPDLRPESTYDVISVLDDAHAVLSVVGPVHLDAMTRGMRAPSGLASPDELGAGAVEAIPSAAFMAAPGGAELELSHDGWQPGLEEAIEAEGQAQAEARAETGEPAGPSAMARMAATAQQTLRGLPNKLKGAPKNLGPFLKQAPARLVPLLKAAPKKALPWLVRMFKKLVPLLIAAPRNLIPWIKRARTQVVPFLKNAKKSWLTYSLYGIGSLAAIALLVTGLMSWMNEPDEVALPAAPTRGGVAGLDAPYELTIKTDPSGAVVIKDDEKLGTTPYTLTLAAGQEAVQVKLGLSGYNGKTLVLSRKMGASTLVALESLKAPGADKDSDAAGEQSPAEVAATPESDTAAEPVQAAAVAAADTDAPAKEEAKPEAKEATSEVDDSVFEESKPAEPQAFTTWTKHYWEVEDVDIGSSAKPKKKAEKKVEQKVEEKAAPAPAPKKKPVAKKKRKARAKPKAKPKKEAPPAEKDDAIRLPSAAELP